VVAYLCRPGRSSRTGPPPQIRYLPQKKTHGEVVKNPPPSLSREALPLKDTYLFISIRRYAVMESQFGRGCIVNLIHIARHFGQPPEQAFYGAADHLTELKVPDQFRGTEIESLVESLRKRLIWHQPGINDSDDATEVNRLLNRLGVAIDRHLGISDPDTGKYG